MCPKRLRVIIDGAVQGVGFRPFIYRLATELELVGWVSNSAQGVVLEVEGGRSQLETFLRRIDLEKPTQSLIQHLESWILDPIGDTTFEIRTSVLGEKTAIVVPDLATCPACVQEIFDPTNRRYRYPFTNCTLCGPRFSIIQALPYDRPNTTMRHFRMCRYCQLEYQNPGDRRFHAQPTACPQCGPHLELWNQAGKILASYDHALHRAADAIRRGKIIAVKGLGGFHLLVDARNGEAVQRLRQAKHRAAKPFALMYPSLELIQAHCDVSDLEAQLLRSPTAPIVLLRRKRPINAVNLNAVEGISPLSPLSASPRETALCLPPYILRPSPSVAPNTPYLGIMLPASPLHHLLLNDLGFPVVATSGNLADEPICTDEQEAIHRLGTIADEFLVHNRVIAHPVDDSIVRILMGREAVLRRARGYAPLPVRHPPIPPVPHLLAVGAHLKNTVAFLIDRQVFVSQHIGDLDTVLAFEAFQQTITSFQRIYELQPAAIACDWHPDYQSTRFAHQLAAQLKIPVIPVQHHYAHVLSCMADNHLEGTVLGVAWDGNGYGLDGTVWGGEFLQIADTSFQRVAHLRPFRLPGAEKAVKQPCRSAIGLLYEVLGDRLFELQSLASVQAFSAQDLKILNSMLKSGLNTPATSSFGRLFDAIASIVGLRQQLQFEGQAAMELEFAIESFETDESYRFGILESGNTQRPMMIDWVAMIREILVDCQSGLSLSHISAKFHNTLVEMVVAIAQRVGEKQIVLTGGCFQNKYLIERAIQRLSTAGFRPYWHQQIPPNDGGIALGQIMAALREFSGGKYRCV